MSGTSTPSSLNLTSSSCMSDDSIATANILINGGPSPVASVIDPTGMPACLAISLDETPQLLYVTQTQANQGGWQSTPIGSAAPLEVVAGVQQQTVHAFYNDTENLYHISQNSDGTWSNPDEFPLVTDIGLAITPLRAWLVAYGVTASGDLQFVQQDPQTNQWVATTVDFNSALGGEDPLLVMVDEGPLKWQLAVPNGTSGLNVYEGIGSSVSAGPTAVNTANPVAAILMGFEHNNSTQLLFSDSKGNLLSFSSANFTDQLTQVANVSAVGGTAFVDTGGLIAAYLADSSGNLFVLHQNPNPSPPAEGIAWYPAIPISSPIRTVNAVPPQQLPAPCLFAVGTDTSLQFYAQDSDTRAWTSSPILQSAPQWMNLVQYRTEVLVSDVNGIPKPNTPVTLSAESKVAVASGGQTCVVGPQPQQSTSLTTDALGRICFTTPAFSLSTPQLQATAEDGTTITISPNQPVFDYLSGVSQTLNELAPFSSNTLSKQFPSQLSNNSALAQAAAQAIACTAAAATASTTVTDPITGQSMTSFSLDLTGPTPIFTPNPPPSSAAAALGLAGGFFDDIGQFASDVWHALRKGVIEVAHLVVDVANKTVQLIAKIGSELQTLGTLVLEGLESVASVLHGVFQAIGAFASEVVQWLRAFFSWGDIWDTKNALESILNQAMPQLSNLLTYGKQVENGFFVSKESEVKNYFDQLKTSFGTQTLQSLMSQGSSSLTQVAAAPSGGSSSSYPSSDQFQNNVQHNWVLDKVMTLLKDLESLVPENASITQPFSDLQNAFNSAWPDLETALKTFWDSLAKLITDPKSFASLQAATLLDGVEALLEAALKLADGIVSFLIDLANIVVTAANGVWTADLSSVPLLGAFYSMLQKAAGDTSNDPCTIAGLFSLALAVPLTLVYKLINGANANPFPGGKIPSLSSAGEYAVKFALVGVLLIGAYFDTCTDAVTGAGLEVGLPIELIAGLIIPVLAQSLAWPGGIPFLPVTLKTTADKVNFAKWMSVWCLPLINTATMLLPGVQSIAKYIDPFGVALLTSFAIMEMVAAVVAAILGGLNPVQITEAFVYPIANLFQFLRLESVIEATEGGSLAIKLLIDFFDETGDAALVALG